MSLPRLFGSYLLLEELASGITSEVYLARTVGQFSRLCTVKVIRQELARLPEFKRRFRQDAAMLVRLIHGNLVQVLEVGQADDRYFIAMEFVDGIHLPDLLDELSGQDALLPEVAMFVGLEMCEALNYISLRRREVEGASTFAADAPWPLEVMLSFDGVVKVVDLGSFGAVRLGEQKVTRLFQSPGYAVPEVVLKQPLDVRSDVFAVGLVVWQLLSGTQLVAADPTGYVRQVLSGSWTAPLIDRQDVPGDIIRAVASMLSLDPKRRPRSLEEARDPLVSGLRRLSPSFGSAALSAHLKRACPAYLMRMDEMMRSALDREVAQLATDSGPEASKVSFGLAGDVDREIGEAEPLEVGGVIPGTRYKMVSLLGKGFTGEVYAAQHMDLERKVAVKILSPDLARRSRAIEVFRMEARACSRVGHPNIVDVLDFGELSDGRFYFAMELLEGESLAAVMAREGILEPGRVVGIFRQVARALHAVHDSGIVHRDLKPENIMLMEREGKGDYVKILDFGGKAFVSEGEGEGDRVGTTGYMAPELVRSEISTPAMDIYSAGVLLYQALSGELPYPAQSHEAFISAQGEGPPPALRSRPGGAEVPEALERVAHRALERSPGARHPSMADFEADLLKAQREAALVSDYDGLPPPTGVLDERAGREARPARARPAAAPSSRNWIFLGVGAGALVVIMVAVLLRDKPRPAPREAPPPPAAGTSAGEAPAGLSLAHRELLRKAEQAAAEGKFTNPEGESALDLLLKVEREAPDNDETRPMRQRFARLLQGAGDRLVQAGAPGSARTLYREALLFTPDARQLEVLAYPPSKAGKPAAPGARRERPAATDTEVAWLLSMIQLAVSEGRYIAPAGKNALYFLRRLKVVDPSGERTVEARARMSRGLLAHADKLMDRGELAGAEKALSALVLLDPENRAARAKLSQVARELAKAKRTAPPPAKAEKKPRRADRERARQLVTRAAAALGEGKLVEARRLYREATAADSSSGKAALGLATVAFEQGKNAEAVEVGRRATRLLPRSARAHTLLGDAYFNLRRNEDAARAWKRALELKPDSAALKRRLDKVGGY